MAYLLVNGVAAIDATLTLPRVGPWTADVVVDTTALSGSSVKMQLGGDGSMAFVGTLYRSGTARGAAVARIVGGAGGFGKTLPAKSYGLTVLKLPLSELLTAAGETLAATSDATVLATQLRSWARFQTSAGSAMAALVHGVSTTASWRVLPNGTVWVGAEYWPASALLPPQYALTKDDPNHNRQEIAADVPAVYPGQTFAGRKVSVVEHRVRADRIRTLVYFEG